MNSSNETLPTATYAGGRVSVSFANGVLLSFPTVGNCRLEAGTEEQLANIEVDEDGLHWPEIDEDLSFEGLLKGDYGQYVHAMH